MITVQLNLAEIAVLGRQHPSTKANGGWQRLLVTLQEKLGPSGVLSLTLSDVERINRYAFSYGNGGWEGRLRRVFERTLGPELGRQYLKSQAA